MFRLYAVALLSVLCVLFGCAHTHNLLHEVEEPSGDEVVGEPDDMENREEIKELIDSRIELYVLRDRFAPIRWGSQAKEAGELQTKSED